MVLTLGEGQMYLEEGISSGRIAKELNILSSRQVLKWVKKYELMGEESFIDNRGKASGTTQGRPRQYFKTLEEENEYLRAKLALFEKLVEIDTAKKK